MRTIRCHVSLPLAIGQRLALPETTSNHLVRVLRLAVGDGCALFNGDGHDYQARLLSLQKRGAEVEITGSREAGNESPLRITLAQGIARGEKMDLILQKATELGVTAVAPIVTERTEVKLDGERSDRKRQHWLGVLAAACEQSGRACLPALADPINLARYAAAETATLKLVLDPQGELTPGSLRPLAGLDLALVVGPEGGLSERDLASLRAGGFRGLRLGPRILRTETAGLAAIAALQALYGDW